MSNKVATTEWTLDKINRHSRCWLELSRSNLRHNFFAIKKSLPADCKIIGMIKANAYGHGDEWVARELTDCGIDYLGVASLAEAIELRQRGITTPIISMGPVQVELALLAAEYEITQLLSSFAEAAELASLATKQHLSLKFQLKLDTGMSRLGFSCRHAVDEVIEEIYRCTQLESIEIEGILTHFNNADAVDSDLHREQVSLFKQIVEGLEQRGIVFQYVHSANSASILSEPIKGNMVRPGILLYGCTGGVDNINGIDLKPVMSFKARLVAVRQIQKGDAVSYGPTFVSDRTMKIGVVEAGYADGILRTMSNQAVFSIRGQAAPVIGTVCMDRLMVDLSEVTDPQVGDEVTIFGEEVSTDRQASRCGTIAYELTCSVRQRVPRFIVD